MSLSCIVEMQKKFKLISKTKPSLLHSLKCGQRQGNLIFSPQNRHIYGASAFLVPEGLETARSHASPDPFKELVSRGLKYACFFLFETKIIRA